jgi:hypothetical protein
MNSVIGTRGRLARCGFGIAAAITLIACPCLRAQEGDDAGQAKPKKKPAAEPAKVIRLFDGKTLKGWKELTKIDFLHHGKVTVKDGEIVIGMGEPMTGIKWVGQPLPKVNYEVTLEARRKEGMDFFCGMTFPVKKSHCSLILGGWGGSLTGLSSLDGFDASENETTNVADFKEGQWYKVRVKVTEKKIETWLDDEKIVDAEIEDRQVSVRWEMEQMPPFGFATYMTTGGVRNIVIKRLDK